MLILGILLAVLFLPKTTGFIVKWFLVIFISMVVLVYLITAIVFLLSELYVFGILMILFGGFFKISSVILQEHFIIDSIKNIKNRAVY